jgi:branched-chain amino acid transport system permease protein
MEALFVGINTNWVMTLSFTLSAAIGALAGVLVTPITNTAYDVGIALALKGFAAAMLGGMGSPVGALAGGFLVGLVEALTAGYVSLVDKTPPPPWSSSSSSS